MFERSFILGEVCEFGVRRKARRERKWNILKYKGEEQGGVLKYKWRGEEEDCGMSVLR